MGLFQPFLGLISGKVAGSVFAHNRGGQYIRGWVVPTNPNTPEQQNVRSAMASLVIDWKDTLTQAQRDIWETYGANVEMTNRLGDPIFLTGQNHFIRSNVPRIANGVSLVTDGPTTFNLGSFAAVSVTIDEAEVVVLVFDDTEDWTAESTSWIFAQQSTGQNQTVNFFKSPFQQFFIRNGSAVVPPTSPLDLPSNVVYTDGQKAFFRLRISRGDGRLSAVQIVSTIVDIP